MWQISRLAANHWRTGLMWLAALLLVVTVSPVAVASAQSASTDDEDPGEGEVWTRDGETGGALPDMVVER